MRILIFACTPWLIIFAFNISEPIMIICAFFVGLFGQGMKVTNDALVQSKIDDEYRGRVFAFYDVAVNAGIVTSAVISALILPKNGDSMWLPLLIALTFLLTGAIIMKKSTFSHSTR
jgi:MFS family permease